jgi:O-antigen ligase
MTPEAIAMGEKLNINTAHNGYLEIYLNGGVIGVALLLAVIFSAARSTAKYITMGLPVGSLYAALLLSCLIYNYTEATFNKGHIIGIVVWLIAIRYPPPVAARSGIRTRQPKEDGPIPGLSPPLPQS